MVDEDVVLADHREQIRRFAGLAGESRRGARRERRLGEVGAVRGRDRPEVREVQHRRDAVDVALGKFELGQKERDHVRRHVGRDLEAHRPAEAPAAEFDLDRFEQVLVLGVVEVQVRVARHTEREARTDPHAGEQVGEIRGDDLLDRNEAIAAAERDEPRQDRVRRHLDAGEAALALLGILDRHREVERQRRDVGEGVPGVDGERGEDGEDLFVEDLPQGLQVCTGQIGVIGDDDARLGELGSDLVDEDPALALDERAHALAHLGEGLEHGASVRERLPHPDGELVLQPGHAYLEELVQARGEDGEELRPRQERRLLLVGELEDAVGEVEPRELPVDEPIRPEALRRLVDGLDELAGCDFLGDLELWPCRHTPHATGATAP